MWDLNTGLHLGTTVIACVPIIIHPPLAKYVPGIRLGTESPAVSNKDEDFYYYGP